MAIELDKSGGIDLPHVVVDYETGATGTVPRTTWGDLTPFTQGYVEALLASLYDPVFQKPVLRSGPADLRAVRFSDLAPETLAAILKDCAEGRDAARGGRPLWEMRQRGDFKGNRLFPPVTPYLGDDGKVYLRTDPARG